MNLQSCILKMCLGGGKLSFKNVGGDRVGEGVYDVRNCQNSRGAKVHIGGAEAPPSPCMQLCEGINGVIEHFKVKLEK